MAQGCQLTPDFSCARVLCCAGTCVERCDLVELLLSGGAAPAAATLVHQDSAVEDDGGGEGGGEDDEAAELVRAAGSAMLLSESGDYEAARKTFEHLVRAAQQGGDREFEAHSLANLAHAMRHTPHV